MQGHSSCYGSMDGHGQGSVIPQPWEQSQNQGAQFCGNLVAGSPQNQPVQVHHCSGHPAVMYAASGHQLQPVQQPQQAQSGQHFSTSMPADPAVQDFAGSHPNAVGLVGGTPQGVVACGTCGTCFAGSASGAMHHLQPGALRMQFEQQNLALSQLPGQQVVSSAPWHLVASGYSPHGTSVSGYEPYAPHQVRTPPHLTRLQRPPALQQQQNPLYSTPPVQPDFDAPASQSLGRLPGALSIPECAVRAREHSLPSREAVPAAAQPPQPADTADSLSEAEVEVLSLRIDKL